MYHTPGSAGSMPADAKGGNGNSVEVQMAWGGSSTYTFQVPNSVEDVMFGCPRSAGVETVLCFEEYRFTYAQIWRIVVLGVRIVRERIGFAFRVTFGKAW